MSIETYNPTDFTQTYDQPFQGIGDSLPETSDVVLRSKAAVEWTLSQVREFEPEDHAKALFELKKLLEKVDLTLWVRANTIDELIAQVPAVGELRKEMSHHAHMLLDEADNVLPVEQVEYLGYAADVIQEPEILEEALHLIDDTQEDAYTPLKVALEGALDGNELFTSTYPAANQEYIENLHRAASLARKPHEYDPSDSSTWNHGVSFQPMSGELPGDAEYEAQGSQGYPTPYEYGDPGHEMTEDHLRDLRALLARESIRR